MRDLGRIKGVAFGEFLEWYEFRHGSETIKAVITDVEGRHSAGLDAARKGFGVLPSQWYRAELVHDLLDRLTGKLSDDELEVMALDAANHIMNRTIRGVYRTIFSMIATPDRYIRHIHRLWSLHYDAGSIVAEVIDERTHRVSYVDWAAHHPFICRMNMAAAVPIYRAMGCRTVTHERIGCVSKGAVRCANLVRFTR